MIVQPRTSWLGRSLARLDAEQAEREAAPEWIKAVFGTGAVNPEQRETIKAIGTDRGTVGFECEVVQPQSGRYKTVYVHVPAEQVLALLKLCREAAAEQRSQAMS